MRNKMDDYFYVSTYVVDSYMDMLRKLDCIDQRCAAQYGGQANYADIAQPRGYKAHRPSRSF